MPKKWREVVASAEYRALSPAERDAAREQYFARVVAPGLSPDEAKVAREQFMRRAPEIEAEVEKQAGPSTPKQQKSDAFESLKRAVMMNVPGYATYEAVKGGAQTPDVASAAFGDVAQAAALAASIPLKAGAVALARMGLEGKAMNLLAQKLSGVNRAAGDIGGAIAEKAANISPLMALTGFRFGETQYPEVWKNMLARVPRAVGETVGEFGPTAAALWLLGKAPRMVQGKAAAKATQAAELAAGEKRAAELQARKYPVTESHVVPGDVRLKQAFENPALSAEREQYMRRLDEASRGDVASTLGATGEGYTSAELGSQFQREAAKALEERSRAYKAMLEMADTAVKEGMVTGIGERTHAGKLLERRILDDLASQGIDVQRVRQKVLTGEPLSVYDLKGASPSIGPSDVEAAIRFADEASQLYHSPSQLAEAASRFTRENKLFEGKPDASRTFLSRMRGAAVDVAKEILEAADKAFPANTPMLPEFEKQRANWAQSADIARRRETFAPRLDALGEEIRSGMTSPEQVFQRDILGGGAQRVREWKRFLEANGADTGIIEKMALDHLAELAGVSSGRPVTADSLRRAWERLGGGKNAELGAELFRPETRAEIAALIDRLEAAEAPLKVMGTKMRGDSPTNRLQSLRRMGEVFAAPSVGGIMGSSIGGGVGALAGMGAGVAVKSLLDKLRTAQQARLIETAPKGGQAARAAAAARQLEEVAKMLEGLNRSENLRTRAMVAAGRENQQ
jgi:hypothetical protein